LGLQLPLSISVTSSSSVGADARLHARMVRDRSQSTTNSLNEFNKLLEIIYRLFPLNNRHMLNI
ncbi:hypothetical protein, partial [Caulobacter sp.]|uniref:hypothetical protein n=1 Tax=Caulobacter sp. TaxID=78 RepID=UPI001B0DEAAF